MKKVLIVEDDLIIALSTEKMIEQIGYQVVGRVTTGEEAVEMAFSTHPDVILMDIRLAGEMDGIEAASQILNGNSNPTLIYVTGNTDQIYKDRAKETGYKAFLTKPVQMQELKKTIG